MDEFLQDFGAFGRLLLKVLFVLVVLRILIFALGLKIVEYIPIIDDIINLLFLGMKTLATWGQQMMKSVIDAI